MARRYKRFLTDVKLHNGSLITMHCANTGAMLGCVYPGSPVHFSVHDNPKRKYQHTLELVETPDNDLICVNTARGNQLVKEVLQERLFEPLSGEEFKAEVKVPDEAGRFDFGNDSVYVEVKSVTYKTANGVGVFPDAISERATRHVEALRRRVLAGDRGVLIFAVLHSGIEKASIASDIDAEYGKAMRQALTDGVEVYALKFDISIEAIKFSSQIPFEWG